MDIEISTDKLRFKERVAGALVKNGKLLTVKVADNNFYCLPGGHAHVGETLLDAMKREFKEEVGIDCTSIRLITFIENFFTNAKGRQYHELSYFYLLDGDIEMKDRTIIEHDEGKLVRLEFKWVDLDRLREIDFRPKELIDHLQKKKVTYQHLIVKD